MITKECNKGKYCCFYVSNFHLEMILLPFIKNKLKNSKITIVTEEDLSSSIEVLIKKVNLNGDEKKEILKLDWNKKVLKIDKNEKREKIFIINGSKIFIDEIHKKLENNKTRKHKCCRLF